LRAFGPVYDEVSSPLFSTQNSGKGKSERDGKWGEGMGEMGKRVERRERG
jgi:hypothetical protein